MLAAAIDSGALPPNSTITANGNSGNLTNLCNGLDPIIELFVTIASAPTGTTPTLTFSVQESVDGSNYATVASTSAISAAGSYRLMFSTGTTTGPIITPYVRVAWTVGGTTPSFTGVTITLLFSNPEES